jgi:hypothetical protein
LGPLGTTATNRPIVPAPGDYDDGEIGGRGNRCTRRKPAPVPLCPPQTPHACPDANPEPPRWEASDRQRLTAAATARHFFNVTGTHSDEAYVAGAQDSQLVFSAADRWE